MRRALVRSFADVLFAAGALLPVAAVAAPTADLHEMKWFVHTDMITGGMDLPFYEALIDAALDDARVAMEGSQGPIDNVCCSQFTKEEHSPSVTLATFGSMGDGLDVVDAGDYAAISLLGGAGSRAFLVDSINNCGGVPAVGCADLPLCDSTADDDPTLTLVVTMDANDSNILGLVIAHERGHNSCLSHVSSNTCELMRGSVNGGCLSASECAEFGFARTTTGGSCVCHTNGGAPEPSDTTCVDGTIVGLCSGGICGGTPGDASVELMASGGPESASGATTNDPLLMAGLPGGWTDLGAFGSTIKGLAHDDDSGTLYGIEDVVGDDDLVIIDAMTGAVSSTVATLTGHMDVISLAFDPGATSGSGDDRLLALSSSGGFETLISLDPSSGAATDLGPLDVGASGGFSGLAYDSVNDKIYAAGFAGGSLWEIDESTCGVPFFCITTEVLAVSLPRIDPALSFSAASGNLYLVGRQTGDRIMYNTIDATTLATSPTLGIDPFTIGGLAAIPVPEPYGLVLTVAGLALIGILPRRRRIRSDQD